MTHECDECGEEFDSERGLHIHQAQKHGDSSEPEENDDKQPETEKPDSVNIGATQLATGTFILGLLAGIVLGGIGGIAATNTIQNSVKDTARLPSPETGSQNTGTDTGNNQDTGSQDTGDQQNRIDMSQIEMKGEPVLGQKDAPVTMVVYEDFQCPFCKRFEEGAMPKIVDNYVETGKVKIVWKDRPLNALHPWANEAAAAAECVYRVGGNDAFWAVKNKIFANQNNLSTSNVQSKIIQWAAEEGVSKSAVKSCLENQNPMKEVKEDSREGQQIGAGGTPTSFVNGVKLVGAQPYSRFKTVIEQQLNN